MFSELWIKICYIVCERVKKNCVGIIGLFIFLKVKWFIVKFVVYVIFDVDFVIFLF